MASRKVDVALAIRNAIGTFADNVQRIQELDDIFVGSGYDSGGGNPITDEDIVAHDLTATDLANCHTFRLQIDKFLGNQVPIQFDYWASINALRTP